MEKITIFCLVALAVSAAKSPDRCICPNTKVTKENLPDARLTQKNTVLSQINSFSLGATDLGKQYLELMKTYLSGNDVSLQNYVINTVLWQTSLQLYLNDRPNTCNIAQMINATVNCFTSGSSRSMLTAILMMRPTMIQSVDIYGITNQLASDCRSIPDDPNLLTGSCQNNGYAYKIQEIWTMRGGKLSTEFKNIVMQMYESLDFTDNYMALMATNSITPINDATTLALVSIPAAVEYANLQGNVDIPSCCCKDRLKTIQELNKKMKNIIDDIIRDQMKIFKAPGVCSSSEIQ